MAFQEIAGERSDDRPVLFQGKMAGLKKMQLCSGQVFEIGPRSGLGEKRIVTAPGVQRRRLVLAEVSLPLRRTRRVVVVILQQRELEAVASGPVPKGLGALPFVGEFRPRIPP